MSHAYRFLPHYTVVDYQKWEGDWELWQGIPVAMTPSPFGAHQRVGKNLVFEIERQIREARCEATVLSEIDWIICEDTVVRPDVVVVCGVAPQGHIEHTPALIAEILSDSTATRDPEAKRLLYEENRVPAYLLVDPEPQSLVVWQRDEAGTWSRESVQDSIQLVVCDDCVLTLERESLFL